MTDTGNSAPRNPGTQTYLLAPLSVHALMVDEWGNQVHYAVMTTPNFDLLDNIVLGDKLASAFFQKGSALDSGVHIHWSLPDALTHGAQDETSGAVDYPCAPNRWFVARIHTDISNVLKPKIALKSWVIESDYLSKTTDEEDVSGPNHNYKSPTIPVDEKDVSGRNHNYKSPTIPVDDPPVEPSFRYLGWKGVYGVDNLPTGEYLDKLTAIGSGDPLFAAYYPNCRNVFGLYDDLEDVENGNLTYFVAGWYADRKQDPLSGCTTREETEACLSKMKWSVPKDTKDVPALTLCHGMVCNLSWKGKAGPCPKNIPDGNPDVAVGNTSIEALAALLAVKTEKPEIERLMQGFMYDLLSKWDAPDGIVNLEEKIHQNGFDSTNGGMTWVIERTPEAPKDERPHSQVQPFPGNLHVLLSKLNKDQEEYERLQRYLVSLQRELYSTWYRYILTEIEPHLDSKEIDPSSTVDLKYIETVINNLIGEINELKDQLTLKGNDLTNTQTALDAQVKQSMPFYELKQEAGQRYWISKNPLVLFAGQGVDRAFNHGLDDRFTSDGTVLCRISGQPLNGITVAPASSKEVTISSDDIIKLFQAPVPVGPAIPEDIFPLLYETIFLDVAQAVPLAVSAFNKARIADPSKDAVDGLAKTIKKAQTMPWNAALYSDKPLDAQLLSESAGFLGTLPSKIGINPWKAPWVPLFMDWSMVLYSDDSLSGENASIKNWTLNDLDYGWNTSVSINNDGIEHTGRVILTPHASINLRDVMMKYIENLSEDDPKYIKLNDVANRLGNLNILSQALSGFNENLIMRKQTLQLQVFDPDGNDELAKKVATAVGEVNDVSPQPQIKFHSIRAGFAKINKMWIVDAFGQIQYFVNDAQSIPVTLSESVKTPVEYFKEAITLPPRIMQPGRLLFKWLSAGNEEEETNSDPATSPICGWILPNHLDKNLMVYDSAGILLGSLQTQMTSDNASAVVWWGPPGPSYKKSGTPPEMNKHLKGFVDEILGYNTQKVPALEQLLYNIDENLHSVFPSGARENKSLSVLIGRPLAVVRASARLELDGYPAYNQSFETLGKRDTDGFEKIQFPVRMGDTRQIGDGLIGFFVDNNDQTYKTFHPVSGGDRTNIPPYIDYNTNILLACDDTSPDLKMTFIIDPRAGVHLTSGILPVKYVEFPRALVSEALKNIYITFLVSPLINNPLSFRIPLPAGTVGDWSWVYPTDSEHWPDPTDVSKANSNVSISPGQQQANEGWLKLMNSLSDNK